MHNQYKLLAEKYQSIQEDDKEDIMTGLEELEKEERLKRQRHIERQVIKWRYAYETVMGSIDTLVEVTHDPIMVAYHTELAQKYDNGTLTEEEEEIFMNMSRMDETIGDIINKVKF